MSGKGLSSILYTVDKSRLSLDIFPTSRTFFQGGRGRGKEQGEARFMAWVPRRRKTLHPRKFLPRGPCPHGREKPSLGKKKYSPQGFLR